MADEYNEEFELVTDSEPDIQVQNRQDKRLKDLSAKVKLTAEELAEKNKLLEEKDAALTAAQKDNEFLKDFSNLSSKYAGAMEHQDAIREKVLAGYSTEDAIVAVLNKEGKLPGIVQAPVVGAEDIAGGSAPITLTPEGAKSPSEMSQEERRAELSKHEGELNAILYPSRGN